MAKSMSAPDEGKSKGPPPPAPGHSQLDDTTFLHFVNVLAQADLKLEEAKSGRRTLRKQAKAAGIDLGHLDAVVRMADWGRDEVTEFFSTRARYALWLSLPVGQQADLFVSIEKGADADVGDAEFWGAKGFQAGVTGKDAKAPAECPMEFVQDFLHQWNAGQAKIAEGLKTVGSA